jgi:hypothetical protein
MAFESSPVPVPPVPLTKKIVVSAGVVIILGILPVLLLTWWVGPVAAASFPLGLLGAILAAKDGSREAAISLAPVAVVAGTLSALTAGSWWWVLLLAGMGLLIGAVSKEGQGSAIVKISLVVVAAGVHRDATELLLFACFLAVGYALGLLIARTAGLGSDSVRRSFEHVSSLRAALLGAVALGLAAGMAVWLANSFAWSKALWIPLLFLVFLEFYIADAAGSAALIGARVVGGIIGIAVILPLLNLSPRILQGIIFTVLISVALAISDSIVWLSTALITASVVLVSSVDVAPGVIEGQRLIAIVVAMLLVGFTAWATRWIQTGPRSDPSAAVVSGKRQAE